MGLCLLIVLLALVATIEANGPRYKDGKKVDGDASSGSNVFDVVADLIKEHKVIMFAKSYCPYCKRAKDLLKSEGVEFYAVELDQRTDGSEIQSALKQNTGQRTVPNVFINGKHVGGFDMLKNLISTDRAQFEALLAGDA